MRKMCFRKHADIRRILEENKVPDVIIRAVIQETRNPEDKNRVGSFTRDEAPKKVTTAYFMALGMVAIRSGKKNKDQFEELKNVFVNQMDVILTAMVDNEELVKFIIDTMTGEKIELDI